MKPGQILLFARYVDLPDGYTPPIPDLTGEPGFVCLTRWRLPQQRMAYMAWDNERAYERFMQGFSPEEWLDPDDLSAQPPNVQGFTILREWGSCMHPESVGEVMSVSERDLDPGMGPEWEEELGRIFDELALMPGFQGALMARHLHLPDRIHGMVRWDDVASFRRSVPDHAMFYRLEFLMADSDF